MFLSRDAIIAAVDAVTETVSVPEWGGDIGVKSMTGAERDEYEMGLRKKGHLDLRNARAKLLVRVLVNENGTRIFADQDALALGKRNAAVLERLYDVAARLSGMTDEAAEDAEGNSEETEEPGDGSPSPSPETSEA
ncbi:phage tail assembly chaperone [Streptomyces cocklensis]|uniref:Tail assembly chaperone n=1 Tax=Actinacidiphila cocklensis TaxID=887465 RepID=A0A9W4DNC6_9ACTN|nr:phage tail assembly chaperone [Actinacidiphila cocklensis]MDD1057914.1 phage tail assembly chaperone [Actinacidiphila cocklensis]CAG6392778.1 Tail assembly chaperone [Actinacidiphila cocklensis]